MAIVISITWILENRFFKLDMKILVCHNFFFNTICLKESISKSLNLGTGTYDFEQYSRWPKLLRVMRL